MDDDGNIVNIWPLHPSPLLFSLTNFDAEMPSGWAAGLALNFMWEHRLLTDEGASERSAVNANASFAAHSVRSLPPPLSLFQLANLATMNEDANGCNGRRMDGRTVDLALCIPGVRLASKLRCARIDGLTVCGRGRRGEYSIFRRCFFRSLRTTSRGPSVH